MNFLFVFEIILIVYEFEGVDLSLKLIMNWKQQRRRAQRTATSERISNEDVVLLLIQWEEWESVGSCVCVYFGYGYVNEKEKT